MSGKLMTGSNFILISWDEQQNIFFNNLAIISKKPTKKTVHDLRVSVKKIRSYLRLQQKITGEEWTKQFVPVKLLFATLGKFRDFEISLLLLKKHPPGKITPLHLFKQFLQLNLALTRQWTKAAAKNFKDRDFVALAQLNKSLARFTNEELIRSIAGYSAGILNKTSELATDFKNQAHEIRKLLKDVYYWLRICSDNPLTGLIDVKKLEQVLDELGAWQDLFIFQKKMKYFRKEYLPGNSKQKTIFKNYEQKITEKQDLLLEKAKVDFKIIFRNK